MINNNRISSRPLRPLCPSNTLRELDPRIRHEHLPHISPVPNLPAHQRETTHNIIILNPIRLTPRTHHPRIIHRNHHHQIHTLPLDLIQMLNEAWQMTDRAAWRESARDSEKNDFFVCEFGACVVGLRDAAGCEGGFFFGVWDPARTRNMGGQSMLDFSVD